MALRRSKARSRGGPGPSGGGSVVKPQPVLGIRPLRGQANEGCNGHLRTSVRCAITPIIARRTGVRKRPFCRPHRGWPFGPGGGFPADSPQEEPSRARDPTSGRRHSMGIHSIGIHSIGIHSYGMHSQWNGLVGNALESFPYQWIAIDCLARRATGCGKRPTSPGALSLQFR